MGERPPRPLQLGFDQLVMPGTNHPVIAFGKKGVAKTTHAHIVKAVAVAALRARVQKWVSMRHSK